MLNVIQREVLKIDEAELIRPPLARQLVTGKHIVVFNIILTEKTHALNTGQRIDYRDDVYEVMNREAVESPVSYTKFNCVRAGGTGERIGG